MFLENATADDEELPAVWARNRGLFILLNLAFFVPGVAGFLYLSWLHIAVHKPRVGALLALETGAGQQPEAGFPTSKVKFSRVGGYLWSVVVHLVLQSLPYVVVKQWQSGASEADVAITTATVFTVLTVAYGLREIKSHLQNYFQPRLQKHIIRILGMPIIYAIDCLVSLTWMEYDAYVHLIREQYEAYTVWSFQALMMEFLTNVAKDRIKKGQLKRKKVDATDNGENPLASKGSVFSSLPQFEEAQAQYLRAEERLILLLEEDGHSPNHMFPVNCFMKPWRKGQHFLTKCRAGVLQYVAYSSSMSLINLILELTGNYHEGEISIRSGYAYIVVIRTISQTWALYCLVLFYHVTADLLAPIRPFP